VVSWQLFGLESPFEIGQDELLVVVEIKLQLTSGILLFVLFLVVKVGRRFGAHGHESPILSNWIVVVGPSVKFFLSIFSHFP
jgi:hypothetical protein